MKLKEGVGTYSYPDDLERLEMASVYIHDRPYILEYVSAEHMTKLELNKESVKGVPTYFSIVGTKLKVWPTPDKDYEAKFRYVIAREF